jgi:hypothetical protein
MSRRYKRDDFTEQLNTTFEINFTPDIVKDAELIQVSDLEGTGNYESFSITFLVSEDCPVYQQIYPIDHAKMGNIELFLVPSGKDEKGTTYVSVFNYPKE